MCTRMSMESYILHVRDDLLYFQCSFFLAYALFVYVLLNLHTLFVVTLFCICFIIYMFMYVYAIFVEKCLFFVWPIKALSHGARKGKAHTHRLIS